MWCHLFKNRGKAGRALVFNLQKYNERSDDVLILALPRGGVPVGYEIAKALKLPMDVWIVRKLGIPGHEEYAMGAIATGKLSYINRDLIQNMHISDQALHQVIAKETQELDRRYKLYKQGNATQTIKGKEVIIVDDGLATGSTMKAAIKSIRSQDPKAIIVAIPVGSRQAVHMLEVIADQVICLKTPEPFYSVGMWYESFPQISDEEVQDLLSSQTWIDHKEDAA